MVQFRLAMVSRSKPILNRKPPFDTSIIPYCRHITKRADLSDRFLCRSDRLYEFSAILFPSLRGRWRSDTINYLFIHEIRIADNFAKVKFRHVFCKINRIDERCWSWYNTKWYNTNIYVILMPHLKDTS